MPSAISVSAVICSNGCGELDVSSATSAIVEEAHHPLGPLVHDFYQTCIDLVLKILLADSMFQLNAANSLCDLSNREETAL